VPSQRQIDLEVELLERKVRLFLGRAELIEKRDQPAPQEVQDDVTAIHEKWNSLLKLADAARRDDADNERLRRQAAEVSRDVACILVLWKVGKFNCFRHVQPC